MFFAADGGESVVFGVLGHVDGGPIALPVVCRGAGVFVMFSRSAVSKLIAGSAARTAIL
jgi:hypothetical protein